MSPQRFDLAASLPTGTTVLEASAGTGKTYTIAALATRYVAEGRVGLPEMLLVTFSRAATQELRERVRARLVSAERGLRDPATARAGDDPVLRLLADVDDDEAARRHRRLRQALAEFDTATIATTHQFCQQMLAGLGLAGDADPDAVFVESVDDLVAEVVDDFYLRKFARHRDTPAFDVKDARTIARHVVADPHARLEPADAPPDSAAGIRYAFATAVRAEVARRKRTRRVYTYDDMLTRLLDALRDPTRGAAERLRRRYPVVLVDEFQDTDPLQWEILRRAFHGHSTLVLIGDPKQAIYAFRGADVYSYLDAVEHADHHATLDHNWRSDEALLRALDTVFGRAALGDNRIVVRPVRSAHPGRRLLRRAPVDTPLRIRLVRRDGLRVRPNETLPMVDAAQERVARDLAADVSALLTSSAQVGDRPVAPRDVAVLVRTNDQAGLVRDALAEVGVPAVVLGTASVFATPVAREWLTLLQALVQPRAHRSRAAALTCFLGRSVADLCGPDGDRVLDEVGATLRRWARILQDHGVAALLEAVTTGTGLPERLLATTDGERRLTDLRHIGQALHTAAVTEHLGPVALTDWLRHRIDEAATDVRLERSRRLESDAAAVQIITVHRSKGLEFPIVYVPFGWDDHVPDPRVPLLHENGTRVLDVGGPGGPQWAQRCLQHRAEESGEDLRLLYVAMTRAQAQVVCWWAPAETTPTSPLHRLLLGQFAPGTVPPQRCRVPGDQTVLAELRKLESPDVAVEVVTERTPARFTPAVEPSARLETATFTRPLDTTWRRTSYSALTAGAHEEAGVTGESENTGTDDEAAVTVSAAAATVPAVPSPMAKLPVGPEFGTLVHAVLERTDFTAADPRAELAARAREQLARLPTPGVTAGALAEALAPALLTPLGPVAGDLRLADVPPRDRLTELDFELPLCGGDHPDARGDGSATLADVAALLRTHLPDTDPLAGYADVLGTPPLAPSPLRGYLTGSIDAVLRLGGPSDPRYLVVDYKTNWLGPVGPDGPQPLTAAHYAPPVLAQAMIAAHYPLQALLYTVALHRFLRWRQPGYDPDRHLGGVLYLFLRGMCGPDTPRVDGVPCGVFGWHPPAALVTELSDLLDEGVS